MLTIHPIIQSSAILLAIYVLYLGIQRFRFLSFHQKVVFPWKRHAVLGLLSLGLLLGGIAGGMLLVYVYWHGILITGIHGTIGLVMVPLLIFGMVSGLYMNSRKKRRRLLPLIHGLNNVMILALALAQIMTGSDVYRGFVLGG